MDFVAARKDNGIATLTLSRGRVNALNGAVVDQLRAQLENLEIDREVTAVVLTGSGKFFSFGFDIPEFLASTKEEFAQYLVNFTDLYTYLFLFPKPVIAAINGHAMAGGCMLTLACDHRVMTNGKAKISLNEIGFGSSVFAGSTEMLRFWVGNANATTILYTGAIYQAEEARDLGLVHEASTEQDFAGAVEKAVSALQAKASPAFASIKSLLRKSVAEEMRRREASSIKEFVEIWYSHETWANLEKIKIY